MTDTAVRAAVLASIVHVAPEVDVATLAPDTDLRDELDLDSMDFLNVVVGIHDRTGVEIPERDYPLVLTLDACVRYVEEHLAAAGVVPGTVAQR